MDIVHGARMDWSENLASHRAGRMAHKRLFEGEENTADNYLLVLANEGSDYYSPRHRHAWDQVRFCLEGTIPIARDVQIDAGEVGYFPEGVYYGPQEGGTDRLVLLLQMGGASGLGYLSADQLREGRERLREVGVFEQGVFRRTRGEGKKNQDAYEAIWQLVTGRPLVYPRPRYRTPVVLRPDGFTWRQISGAPGARSKCLGTFPERGLSLEMISLAADSSFTLQESPARRFVFVRTGQGSCNGEPFAAHSAIRLHPGEAAIVAVTHPTELLVIAVPILREPHDAIAHPRDAIDHPQPVAT